MSKGNLTTRASVVVEVVVDLSQGWGPECTTQQVFDQAKREAANIVKRLIGPAAGVRVVRIKSTNVGIVEEVPCG